MPLDLDLTVRNRSAHLAFRRARRKWRGWRCCALAGVDASATVTTDEDGVVDGDRLHEGKTKEWSTTSIASWSVEEAWPEGARALVSFSYGRLH
jgi:hypothetical protein